MGKIKPVLLVHGGAWAMPDYEIASHERGIGNALAAGWAVLERGGTSVAAVEAAVVVMEDDQPVCLCEALQPLNPILCRCRRSFLVFVIPAGNLRFGSQLTSNGDCHSLR